MIRFFKRLYQFIVRLFSPSIPQVKPEPEILFYDHTIIFKNPPLIGMVFHEGKKMFRVVDYDICRWGWKCYIDIV